MNEQEPNLGPQEDAHELRQQIDFLSRLFLVAMVILVVLGLTVDLYFGIQIRWANHDLQQVRPALSQFTENQQTLNTIVSTLENYGKTNADFVPILSHYGLTPSTNMPFKPH